MHIRRAGGRCGADRCEKSRQNLRCLNLDWFQNRPQRERRRPRGDPFVSPPAAVFCYPLAASPCLVGGSAIGFGLHGLGRWWFFGGFWAADRGFGVDRLGWWWVFEGSRASGHRFAFDRLNGWWRRRRSDRRAGRDVVRRRLRARRRRGASRGSSRYRRWLLNSSGRRAQREQKARYHDCGRGRGADECDHRRPGAIPRPGTHPEHPRRHNETAEHVISAWGCVIAGR